MTPRYNGNRWAVISPTFCGFWLILLVSTDSMASLAPTYSTPEERSRRKVLKLAVSLNTSGPSSLESGQGNRGSGRRRDCQSSEVYRKLWVKCRKPRKIKTQQLTREKEPNTLRRKWFEEIKDNLLVWERWWVTPASPWPLTQSALQINSCNPCQSSSLLTFCFPTATCLSLISLSARISFRFSICIPLSVYSDLNWQSNGKTTITWFMHRHDTN